MLFFGRSGWWLHRWCFCFSVHFPACLDYLRVKWNVGSSNTFLASTETASDFSKCERGIQPGRQCGSVGRDGVRGSALLREQPTQTWGWARSLPPEDLEIAGPAGRRGRQRDDLCANADRSRRAQTELGQESDRPFVLLSHTRLSPSSRSGGVLRGGRQGADGDSQVPRRAAGGAAGPGGALAEWRAAGSRRPDRLRRVRGAGAGSRGAAHLSAPLSTSPSTAAPTYADISFIASCVSLQRVSFALGSCSCPLFLPLSTSLCSLAARLLAHFPTHYGRGSQPSSENTTKPALFMTIQRGRRQYGAASQAASRPLRPRPWSRGTALGHAPSRELRAPAHLKCALLPRTRLSESSGSFLGDCRASQTSRKLIRQSFLAFAMQTSRKDHRFF